MINGLTMSLPLLNTKELPHHLGFEKREGLDLCRLSE